jgi:hypothetical protein
MLAQNDLRNAKVAEFETDAPENIWHPEFKQEQVDRMKNHLQAAIGPSLVSDQFQLYEPSQLYEPLHQEVPFATSSSQSIREQPPQPVYDHFAYQQPANSFQSQFQQPADIQPSQSYEISGHPFPSVQHVQPQDSGVPIADHRALEFPENYFPDAGTKMVPQIFDFPSVGTKVAPPRQEQQSRSSRAPPSLQLA